MFNKVSYMHASLNFVIIIYIMKYYYKLRIRIIIQQIPRNKKKSRVIAKVNNCWPCFYGRNTNDA